MRTALFIAGGFIGLTIAATLRGIRELLETYGCDLGYSEDDT